MEIALHLSSSSTSRTPSSLPNYPDFPLKRPILTPNPRPTNLQFPSLSTTNTIPSERKPIPSLSPSSPNARSDFPEKMLFLDSIGIDFASFISTHPQIAATAISDLRETVDFLQSIGLTRQDLRRAASMCPEILSREVSSILTVFTFLLREVRVNRTDIRRVIHRRPRLLACGVDTRLRPTLYFLQSIGIPEISKHTSLLSCSVEDKLVPRISYLLKIGISYREAMSMFRRFPALFCYSIEFNLEPKFDYLVVEMGRELKELVEFPQYFSFSLENRIMVRHQQCIQHGVVLSLPVMLTTKEEIFQCRLLTCSSRVHQFR
ncbi:transcription termination factor MTEF1, chloroplastic [Impatiens glandulifera]|uniref:transcription termination factor MTEF1, chloroplastic n=1 Tax=Impatiens glandulifera TaxID=253017 RepID=UPI001FB0ABD2|nr:transcription termination factor MTEF1, chloroplastic [Impatiens glandulifera]